MMLEKPKRFFIHFRKIYFTYKLKYSTGTAKDGTEYHGWDEWALVFGIADEGWFNMVNWYYEGHTMKGFAIFGLVFAKYYSYSWEKK